MRKEQAGIWLDSRQAFVIRLKKGTAEVQRIESDIHTGEVKGGSRSSTPWGPQLSVSESKWLERRKHEEKAYLNKVKAALEDLDELYIFGPAEMKMHFEKLLLSDRNFKPVILALETADSMTEPQMIAQVKAFYAIVGSES